LDDFVAQQRPRYFENRAIQILKLKDVDSESLVYEKLPTQNSDKNLKELFYSLDEIHSDKEYRQTILSAISEAKYGLCDTFYDPNLIVYAALGVVPVVIDPKGTPLTGLERDLHFISVDNLKLALDKVSNIDREKWLEMSKNCINWYQARHTSIAVFKIWMNNIKN